MRQDLHNHTRWSDGRLTAPEVLQAARSNGLDLVGITDHFATPKVSSLPVDHLERYRQELRDLQRQSSTTPELAVGLEIDGKTLLMGMGWLPLGALRRLDYLLVEYVGAGSWGKLPLGAVTDLARRVQRPIGLAHCDLAAEFAGFAPDRLGGMLAEHRIFIELNVQYSREGESFPYFRHGRELMPRLAREGVQFSLASDAHMGAVQVGRIEPALEFATELSLPLVTPEFLGLPSGTGEDGAGDAR